MNTETEAMNASRQFCPNLECKARGQAGQGNIVIHSRKRPRYRCKECDKTFSARAGTTLAGLRKPTEPIVIVVTLLAYGCPIQAIVKASGLDERTVASWRDRAGEHCERVHQAMVVKSQLDLQHVQADEVRAKGRGMVVWMAMALMVSTRLWLGGVVSARRERLRGLHTGMYLIGCTYNFCWHHDQLRERISDQPGQRRWRQRTPAMAAGLTDHVWSMHELLRYKVAPALWISPKRRGRPRKAVLGPLPPQRPPGRPRKMALASTTG